MEFFSGLIVETGDPFHSGDCLSLVKAETVFGRTAGSSKPDVGFLSLLISRRHCAFYLENDHLIVRDLGSKHGTAVNDLTLAPHQPQALTDGDKVTLAMGVVSLRVCLSECRPGVTIDFSQTMEQNLKALAQPIIMDYEKRECRVDGKPISLAIKEWLFLSLLHKHVNRLVTYDEIKSVVWAERSAGEAVLPDVGMEEINVLIYRLRRKMGEAAKTVKTVRGCGCLLEM